MHSALETRLGVTRYWREGAICGVALVLLAGIMAMEPISQDSAYHQFADHRTVWGVPNFFNVASNIAFLLVGIAGTVFCIRRRGRGTWRSWMVVFAAATLVAFGSAYYHWAPDNASLVWDRLPMTFGFMGLFVALLAEHLNEKLEGFTLIPALLVGAASVAWWYYADDLRLYVWVQFVPIAIIALLVAFFPGRYTHRRYLVYTLACYVFAKIAEFLDGHIYELTSGTLSGHTLKHLLAALGLLFLYAMLRRRQDVVPLAGAQARVAMRGV